MYRNAVRASDRFDLPAERYLEIGRQIIQEFPNSRMAEEVRERMHTLQKRAVVTPVEAPEADAAPA